MKTLVLGGRGLVGSAFVRILQERGLETLSPSREQLDVMDAAATRAYFKSHRFDLVIHAAARVGGIGPNKTYPFDFLQQNLQMTLNVLNACIENEVAHLISFGSNCAYPRKCPQPMKEEHLLSGPLEPTNEAYAIAKIAGIKLLESYNRQHGQRYLNVIPCGVYGPNDCYDVETGHVLPGVIRRMSEAIQARDEQFVVWGSGRPRREFMYVDDLVDACLFLLDLSRDQELPPWINVGTGTDMTISELVHRVAEELGFQGELVFDTSRPDGMPLKCLDSSRIQALGWSAPTDFAEGLRRMIADYRDLQAEG